MSHGFSSYDSSDIPLQPCKNLTFIVSCNMASSFPRLKTGLTFGLSQAFSQVAAFIRNVIIARLITPEDFGIATTLALTFSFVEMISNVASQTLLVQADYGDEPIFQDTAHALQASRGLLSALMAFSLAGPLASLFGVPHVESAFQWLALVPLVKGLAHTDSFRFQRQMNFAQTIRIDIGTNLLAILSAVSLGLWLRNYWVMVWVLLTQVTCSTMLSHFVAERPYRWAWDRGYVTRIFSFGWPLLINGMLMYLIFQGDRFIIGSAREMFPATSYSLSDLAMYSIAFAMALSPAMLASNVSASFFLPLLSRVRNAQDEFHRQYLICAQVVSLFAICISVPLIIMGGWLVVLIYGVNYAAAESVIGWFAASQSLRMMRIAPTVVTMALGDTKSAMVANVVRVSGFIGVLIVAVVGGPLEWIAICGLAGELLGLTTCLWRLQRMHKVPASDCLKPCLVVIFGMVLAAMAEGVGVLSYGWLIGSATSGLLIGAVLSLMLTVYPELRYDFRLVFFRLSSR